MAIPSFEDWEKGQTGVASAAPKTPVDTGAGKRPRMTFEEWEASQSKQPQVSPDVVKSVAQAPQAPKVAPEDTTIGETFRDVAKSIPMALTEPFADITEMVSPDTATSMRGTAEAAGEQLAGFMAEEGLPMAGGILATVVAPELTIPVAATRYGPALAAMAQTGWAAVTSGAGAGFGEMTEQVAKMKGWLLPDEDELVAPDLATAGKRAIVRGAEETAFNTGVGLLFGALPAATRGFFFSPKEGNEVFLQVMKEAEGGKVYLSDVSDGLVAKLSDAIVTHSTMKSGKEIAKGRAEQMEAILLEGQPLIKSKQDTAGAAMDTYQDGLLTHMPSTVLAQHISMALKDGEKTARSVLGVRYDMIDKAAERIKPIVRTMEVEVPLMKNGRVQYDPIFNKPIMTTQYQQVTTHPFPVDTKDAKGVIERLIEEQSGALEEGARVDFTKFAREQMNLFKMKDEITFSQARTQLSNMDKEARRLDRMQTDEFAATKAKFLRDSISELHKSMEVTAKNMSEAGVTVGPEKQSVYDYLMETNGMWKEVSSDFGNRYIAKFLDKASDEGASKGLALAFMDNRQSADALLKALETSEKAAGSPAMRTYTNENAERVLEVMPKARAAISVKVFETLMSDFANTAARSKTLQRLDNPESRGVLNDLMGTDMLSQAERTLKALDQMEQGGIKLGAYTQFARETAALQTAATAPIQDPGVLMKAASTITAPIVLSYIMKSKKMMKMATEVSTDMPLSNKDFIFRDLIKEGTKLWLLDYQSMTPEERENMEYQVKLQQL